MRIIVCEDYNEMSEKAAELFLAQVTLKPDSVLGFATGSTPLGLYKKLSQMCSTGQIDFSQTVSFNLDEYYPIKKDDPNSYNSYMQENLFSKINIENKNIHLLNGETDDPETECENYERMIESFGGIDMQILGIGSNGHIGFNEPDSVMYPYTHITHLTESTIKANSRFFNSVEEVPRKALTVGILTILSAKRILLMANGAGKKQVISELLGDGIKLNLPAALLKLHSDVTLICDKDAYPE